MPEVGSSQYTQDLSNAAAGELMDWGNMGSDTRAPATNALKTYHDFRTQRNVVSHEPNFYLLQEANYHSNVVTSKISFHETILQKYALRRPLWIVMFPLAKNSFLILFSLAKWKKKKKKPL